MKALSLVKHYGRRQEKIKEEGEGLILFNKTSLGEVLWQFPTKDYRHVLVYLKKELNVEAYVYLGFHIREIEARRS